MLRVLIWNEFRHEKTNPSVKSIYPNGIHGVIKEFLQEKVDCEIYTATLDDPECGINEEILNNTDVMIWWGHKFHKEVSDEIADMVVRHVQAGMGFIALHSTHESKPFMRLMGTTCSVKWRKSGVKERLWNINPSHPIMKGIDNYFELEHVEMYGERFDIPKPDDILMISWYPSGEVFRSVCTWTRGNGRIVHIKPGHETFPIYYNENIQKLICNAVEWCVPVVRCMSKSENVEPLETIEKIEC